MPALLLMAALWGSTLVVMKGVYAHMSPENLLACRFAMAAAAFGILFEAWRANMRTIAKGVILGVLFAAGQLLQAIGLGTTQAAMNGSSPVSMWSSHRYWPL
ncbi:permease of the drug/metabolite transporter [Cutibacterium acnes JCM 18909]|nr:permease of the drug/metabolite transporter [Cutibacterium acnes JCM 18909]